MKQLSFEDPDTKCVKDILWHNLKVADENHNLRFFVGAAEAWFKQNSDKGYQDFEEELRDRDFMTHLIAAKPTLQNGVKLGKIGTVEYEPIFECIYSCRPAEQALSELLTHSKSYQENFDKLAKAGRLVVEEKKLSKSELSKDEKVKILNETEKSVMQKLVDSEVMIRVTTIDDQDFLEQVISEIKEQFGKEPKNVIVGMTMNGGPILGLSIDNKIVSQYGYSVEYNLAKQQVFELVDLRTLYK